MSAIFNTIKEVNICNLETQEEIQVEIIGFNPKFNFLHLKSHKKFSDDIFNPGDKIELKIARNDGIYYFDSTIVKSNSLSKEISINSPKKATRMDRRKASRHKFETEIKIIGSDHDYYGVSFDLSEGGIGFYCKEFFFKEDILFISFSNSESDKTYNMEVTVKDLFVGKDGYIKYGTEFAYNLPTNIKDLINTLSKNENFMIEDKDNETSILKSDNNKKTFFKQFISQKNK